MGKISQFRRKFLKTDENNPIMVYRLYEIPIVIAVVFSKRTIFYSAFMSRGVDLITNWSPHIFKWTANWRKLHIICRLQSAQILSKRIKLFCEKDVFFRDNNPSICRHSMPSGPGGRLGPKLKAWNALYIFVALNIPPN